MIEKHMKLLGMKAEDKVTGLKGVVSCVSFDLYGCVQVVLKPKVKDDGTVPEGHWLDVSRLNVTGKTPVMPMPNFDRGYIAEGKKGPAGKPAGRA